MFNGSGPIRHFSDKVFRTETVPKRAGMGDGGPNDEPGWPWVVGRSPGGIMHSGGETTLCPSAQNPSRGPEVGCCSLPAGSPVGSSLPSSPTSLGSATGGRQIYSPPTTEPRQVEIGAHQGTHSRRRVETTACPDTIDSRMEGRRSGRLRHWPGGRRRLVRHRVPVRFRLAETAGCLRVGQRDDPHRPDVSWLPRSSSTISDPLRRPSRGPLRAIVSSSTCSRAPSRHTAHPGLRRM